jgi:predicted small secreted protein
MKILLKIMLGVIVMGGLLVLSGCNTMEGFGKDLQQVGGEIEESADK